LAALQNKNATCSETMASYPTKKILTREINKARNSLRCQRTTVSLVPQLARTGSDYSDLISGIAVAAGLIIAGFATLMLVRRRTTK
jgi:hypothetical protein